MTRAAHIDYPRALLGREELRHDQIREQEMSDVIRRKLGLQPVDAFRIRHAHDARIVDQSVDRFGVGVDFGARLADLLLRAEIELEKAGGHVRRGTIEDGFRGL